MKCYISKYNNLVKLVSIPTCVTQKINSYRKFIFFFAETGWWQNYDPWGHSLYIVIKWNILSVLNGTFFCCCNINLLWSLQKSFLGFHLVMQLICSTCLSTYWTCPQSLYILIFWNTPCLVAIQDVFVSHLVLCQIDSRNYNHIELWLSSRWMTGTVMTRPSRRA